MRIPNERDRWQNRRTSRVCVVEEIKGGPLWLTTRIGYRYEDSTRYEDRAYGGRRPRKWTSLAYFNAAFTEFEAANNADAASWSGEEERR